MTERIRGLWPRRAMSTCQLTAKRFSFTPTYFTSDPSSTDSEVSDVATIPYHFSPHPIRMTNSIRTERSSCTLNLIAN